MKSMLLILGLMVAMSLNDISGIRDHPQQTLAGFWELHLGEGSDRQHFIARFSLVNGDPACEIHAYVDGIKSGSEPASDIIWTGNSLSMVVNLAANITFTGEPDQKADRITGQLNYQDGSSLAVYFTRLSPKFIEESYPGLKSLAEERDAGYHVPVGLQDGWEVSGLTPEAVNVSQLDLMMEKILAGEYGRVHSVLVAIRGKLVFEEYFDGFYRGDFQSLQSCTKSVGSLLVGLAIDVGYITDVHQHVLDFFKDRDHGRDPEWERVRLSDLLTMTMGLKWDRRIHDGAYAISEDVIQLTLDQKFSGSGEGKFQYRNPQADLLSGIIMEASHRPVQEFAREYLFAPVGIEEFRWSNFKQTDYPLMSGSLALKARDMLRLGQLVLDRGEWKGQQIVSPGWISESTSAKVRSDQAFDYGYLWWIGESRSKPGMKIIFAMGISGQFIVVVPGLSMVVVTTAGNVDRQPETILEMVDEYILKSIGS